MRRVFVVLSGLLFLAILSQFYFAAVGAFDRPQDDDSFALHSVTGMMIIPLLSILSVPESSRSAADSAQVVTARSTRQVTVLISITYGPAIHRLDVTLSPQF